VLYVHRSERADQLVEALGDLLLEPLADPLAPEIVAVPTRGVERWLTQRLSHRLGTGHLGGDGVCANVEFPFPGTLVNRATSRACGFDPDTDPWPPERSVWPLLQLVHELRGADFLASLTLHLERAAPLGPDGSPQPRRFSAVRHVADLYDRYAVHRPEMILEWARTPAGARAHDRGADWQAELWRHLRARIDRPSPAERFTDAATRLAAAPELLDLPDRLSLFGLTRLPGSHLRVLEAIGGGRDVHLFLLHPSNALWDRVASKVPRPAPGLRRQDDPTADLASNPLLRSWGRDAREMQLVLASHGVAGGRHRPVPAERASLLEALQADIRADRRPPGPGLGDEGESRPLLRADDDSLQIHACHGRLRQVEVMRDAVLHRLASDPTLEPRDVIVMCPDIESFAPLIHAAFGSDESGFLGEGEGPGLPRLRVRLADRSLRQTNPLLGVAAHVLALAAGRVTASEVLDLASLEPVSRRFRLGQEELAQIEDWVAAAGIRWGLDGAHRQPWGLQDLGANTWSSGLDRLLLGVTMTEDDQRLFGGTLPVDDVPGQSVELAGRLAELVARIGVAVDELQGPQPLARWCARLAAATESVAEAAGGDGWQHEQLHRVLGEVAEDADGADRVDLDRHEVSSLLAERLSGRPTRANFRTGDLTVCTLVPMRSVPHRVVGLLGLDDGVFPRPAERDGDDLLLAEPHVGDRDGRSEDRQLLLDALLAATDQLIITYAGRDQRTNQERPAAVPVAELLDVVDRTVRVDGPGRARDRIVLHHPLQSFDPRNFTPDALGADRPWSFDPVNLDGARARKLRSPRPPFLSQRLPPWERPAIQLDSLIRFAEHPVRAFLRERLGHYARLASDQINDALPVELDALEKWGVGARMLEARLAGADPEGALAAERARGLCPPGSLAEALLTDADQAVGALLEAGAVFPSWSSQSDSVDINLTLPDGRLLVGTVPGVKDDTILSCTYSALGPRQRLAAWVRFLALSVAHPDRDISAVTIGRGETRRRGRMVGVAQVAWPRQLPLPGQSETQAARARTALDELVDLYDRGMREPLPIYCRTSAAWAEAVRGADEDPVARARRCWESERESPVPAEQWEDEHMLVLDGLASFDWVRAEVPRDYDDELVEAGTPRNGEGLPSSRFDLLARRLWTPLLENETVEQR
jgi:exodeoxyribonuclease V gamma subunit